MKITTVEAIELLMKGEVVALPTETVYGLAAIASVPAAILKIYALKKRPADNPLIIHVSSFAQLEQIAQSIPPKGKELMEKFWPGPLTFILPAHSDKVPVEARAGLPSIAVRMPNEPNILAVIKAVGPLVAPSANLSGKPSATAVEDVEEDFGLDFPVVDGGRCSEGVESTILYYKETWQIARLGAITPEQIASVLGYTPAILANKEEKTVCPGQHYRHYAPQASLELSDQTYTGKQLIVIGFSDRTYPGARKVYPLSHSQDPHAALENLYHLLRQLDRDNVTSAWIDFNFPKQGLFLTLAERLQRASQ